MSVPLKISIACNIVLFSSSVYFYTGTIDHSEDFLSHDSTQSDAQKSKKKTSPEKREKRRKKRRERVAKKMQKKGEGKHSISPLGAEISSQAPRSEEDMDEAIEERAEELAEAKLEERRAKRMDRIASRMEEGVRMVGEEFEWEDAQTEQVLELVMERFDERSALRAEVEAGQLTWPEMHEQARESRDAMQEKMIEMVGEEAAQRLGEELRPPHRRGR